jgi:hypothetical protein
VSAEKSKAVAYDGPHPAVEVPVGDVTLWFERGVPADVDADTAALLVAGGLFSSADSKPSASSKEK